MKTRILNPLSPSVFVNGPKSAAHVTILNASEMPEHELLAWKREKRNNYSVTEPMGRYYLLTISALKYKTAIPPDEALQLYKTMLMTAANAWHDHVIAKNN